ncbi:uroporphyrinogen-III synthase [Dichotomicrobium thermohalophilum]|uniref:Uroporphyrinogen-III synthase n=1 Tax=Dichotomicrobium thermohalophilum TaxID=933063 RepID=A0A397PIA2_9HYPH|nr:uroporphyrinogen-III synthase [Dichotomicrobium thermohalophilum]RIA45401.1 uroporphyrinogen-III synthase [Dichotomicrobium thermohalophilum]
MRVLVTRPLDDAKATAEAVRTRGHEPIIAPLSVIRYETPEPPGQRPAAAIFTSRNAVRALRDVEWAKTLHRVPAYCVGAATAEAARQAGFLHVIAGGGTGAQLAEHIAYTHSPENGPLLYLTGDHLAFDMAAALGARGFTVLRHIVYRSELVTALPEQAERALGAGRVDAVILMSPRTAGHFVDLVKQAGISEQAARLRFLCLSTRVAERLAPLRAEQIRIAARPTQRALLDLLGPSTAA